MNLEPVEVGLPEALMWSHCGEGSSRGEVWSSVVKAMRAMDAKGTPWVCYWHHSKVKRHPRFPDHGAVEVLPAPAPTPVKAFRVRTPVKAFRTRSRK